jgi:lipoate---protein ligase
MCLHFDKSPDLQIPESLPYLCKDSFQTIQHDRPSPVTTTIQLPTNMLCIQERYTDPYFNLAAEEYVLKNFTDDCFILYRNEPSIIVGKHQNTLAEINLRHVRDNKIKVVRRLSGGGTVFHDLGNLNFTFIVSGKEGHLVDFRRFTKPILEVLHKLGIEARFEGRSNLTINGMKFSGNAEHVYKQRTLHHGTLLFSSVMADLSDALKVDPIKYTDKAVKSIRAKVTNISEHLSHPMDVTEFSDMIMEHIRENYHGNRSYTYTDDDIKAIEHLRDEKYRQWEWNFGYSPKYLFEKTMHTPRANLVFHISVEKGIMKEVRLQVKDGLHGDFFHTQDLDVIQKALTGIHHDPDVIKTQLTDLGLNDLLKVIAVEDFISGMF